MASRNFTDPNLIPCLNENYEKEKWLRMHWVNKHIAELERATILNREPTNYTSRDIKESLVANGMPALTRDHIVTAGNRRKKPVKDIDLLILGKGKEFEPVMAPVPQELKNVLYTERTTDYLEKRKLIPPDKRYNFLECTSWKHGWQFDQSELMLRGADYGKKYYLTRMPAVGPQPDPPHYLDCKEISNLCTDMS